ncbi:MAG: endonuclease V [Pseudomonadota bacterium]
MILATDVHYVDSTGYAAGLLFEAWSSSEELGRYEVVCHDVEPYEPGAFYRRELPCLLKLIEKVDHEITTIVIDGHVYLDAASRPGLGAVLYRAMNQSIEVVGVAKSRFHGMPELHAVMRGQSAKPLYVTTTGDLNAAIDGVSKMAGSHRIPTLLKRVDQNCRSMVRDA